MINLNPDQLKASQEFFYFLTSKEKEFYISGSAGTGKTYLLNYLINDIFKQKYPQNCKFLNLPINLQNIVCTATTHKATEILQQSLNTETNTIHSFLNLTLRNNYKTGQEELKINPKTWQVFDSTLLIIDEASMINQNLHNIIKKALIGNSKIIYVGDANQLTAVKSKQYSVFNEVKTGIFLNKIERNNTNSNLIKLCSILKTNITKNITESFNNIKPLVKTIGQNELKDLMQNNFDKENIVYLAYTNKSVNKFNNYYRTNIKKLPLQFQKGETLINSTHIVINKFNNIKTEQEVKILDVHKSQYSEPDLNCNFPGYYVSLIDQHYYSVFDIKNFGSGLFYLPNNIEDYKNALKEEAKLAKQTNDWQRYFKLKNTIPILRSKEAQTVHKSQGSTYDSVIININDLMTCRCQDTFNRLLYVACSRAKYNVYMYCNDME